MWRLLFSNLPKTVPQVWLRGSLSNGQVFNFTCNMEQEGRQTYEIWTGVVRGRVLRLKQAPFIPGDDKLGSVYFWCKSAETAERDIAALNGFFRAEEDSEALYELWANRCPRFRCIARNFRGIRLLNQEPIECLFSFIASTNNHIQRISQMLHRLRATYGEPIAGEAEEFKVFPTPEILASKATEAALRDIGFGYRAKFIVETAKSLIQRANGVEWLQSLRNPALSSDLVRRELQLFSGVGPKVADCVALFSCNRLDIVPVDVHVFALAQRSYDETNQLSQSTTLNGRTYKIVTQIFTDRFGAKAGWAHSVLFTSELLHFQDRLTDGLRQDIIQSKVARTRAKKMSKSIAGLMKTQAYELEKEPRVISKSKRRKTAT